MNPPATIVDVHDVPARSNMSQSAATIPFGQLVFTVVDIETTGLNPRKAEIIEIGVAQITADGQLLRTMKSFVAPQYPVGDSINIHGITDEQLVGAPTFPEIADMLDDMLQGTVMVAHNSEFEQGMFAGSYQRYGRQWPNVPVLCTMTMRMMLGLPAYNERHKLEWACWLHGVHQQQAHRAYDDAAATAELLSRYISYGARKHIHCLGDLNNALRPSWDITADSWQHQLLPLAQSVPLAALPTVVAGQSTQQMDMYRDYMVSQLMSGVLPRNHLPQVRQQTQHLQLNGAEIATVHRAMFRDMIQSTKQWDKEKLYLAQTYGQQLGIPEQALPRTTAAASTW